MKTKCLVIKNEYLNYFCDTRDHSLNVLQELKSLLRKLLVEVESLINSQARFTAIRVDNEFIMNEMNEINRHIMIMRGNQTSPTCV